MGPIEQQGVGPRHPRPAAAGPASGRSKTRGDSPGREIVQPLLPQRLHMPRATGALLEAAARWRANHYASASSPHKLIHRDLKRIHQARNTRRRCRPLLQGAALREPGAR